MPVLSYSPFTALDFDELATLRIAAMRESLERLGRFDPVRARERLRSSFFPDLTWFIGIETWQRVGFYTLRPTAGGLWLDHLYIHPDYQSQGIGSAVLQKLLAEADELRQPIRLGALRGSDSNRFYQRHGFVQTREDEFDIYYERLPPSIAGSATLNRF